MSATGRKRTLPGWRDVAALCEPWLQDKWAAPMNACKRKDSELLGLPTQAKIEAMKAVGLQPQAFGYDPTGRLVMRRDDASLECLLDERQGS